MRKDNLSPGGLGFIPFAPGLTTRRSQICSEWRNHSGGNVAPSVPLGTKDASPYQSKAGMSDDCELVHAGVEVPGLATKDNTPVAQRRAATMAEKDRSGVISEAKASPGSNPGGGADNTPPAQETLDKSIPSIFRKRSRGLKIRKGLAATIGGVAPDCKSGPDVVNIEGSNPSQPKSLFISLSPPMSEAFRCLTHLPRKVSYDRLHRNQK